MIHEKPALRLGAAPIGNLFQAVTDHQAAEVLEQCWALDIRRVDTAPFYGHGESERRIGAFMAAHPDRAFAVSTKVGRVLVPGHAAVPTGFVETPALRPVFDYSRDGVRRAFDDSLRRLGVDRVEMLLLHDIGQVVHGDDADAVLRQALDEALPAMRELQAQGRCSKVGLGVNEWQVCQEVLARTDLDVILLAGRYTLLDQSAAAFLDHAGTRGTDILAAGVFNSGLLAGGTTFNYAPAPQQLVDKRDSIQRVCARHGVALPAAAIHFAAMHPAVREIVLGLRSPLQVREAADWYAVSPPHALWEDLREQGLIP
jgi:D-threo-aldose 1-dehydrogenase